MRVHHIAFRTTNLERLERFYVDTLGFSVVRRTTESIWLDAAGSILMLERRGPTESAISRNCMELVAFAIDAKEGAAYEARLARAGAIVDERTAFTIYVRDPDDRRIGFSSFPEPLA